MREQFKGVISSSFYDRLYTHVFTCYQNKFKAIQRKLKFEVSTFDGFEFYKRDSKNHKKGELKRVLLKKKQTPLSNCLTYLARYGNENIIEYIKCNIDKCDDKKREFYHNILRCCEKFGFERLYNLALSKRNKIVKRYSEHPIEFKSLSFGGRSRKKYIVGFNKRFGSKINSFISLSGFDRKSLDIPVKYHKGFHGNMKDYRKDNPNYEYVITFDEKTHQVKVNLCKDGERYIPEPNGKTIGIDVNCKHNLFSLSNETTYDYDRKLVNDYCKLLCEIDNLKSKDKTYLVGKRKQCKLDKLKEKVIKFEQQTIATMCKDIKAHGFGHIVMEDLNNSFGKCYVTDKDNENINYNRKVKFLGLSSLKGEVEHIASKYGIAVSTVHPSYTSKMCPVCGCIDDGNRPTQEEFQCIECGHKDNADLNAAKNIRNRVLVTVLRESLLKQLDNGAYEPRPFNRSKVKDVLLSFRRSLPKVGSECIEGRVTTFEYI
jgi:transposase, IS605 OrfB family, central region